MRAAAKALRVSPALIHRLRAERSQTPTEIDAPGTPETLTEPECSSSVQEHVTL
jgi:hypothetical protein